MLTPLDNAYKLAAIRGLFRIANRIRGVEISPSPMGTAHTDGSKIVIDPLFLGKIGDNTEELLFLVAHEYYHIIYDHVRRARDNNYKMGLYNVACDLIINEHLINFVGLKRPENLMGVFRDNKLFEGMPKECDTSNKIYEWLLKNGKSPEASDDMGDMQESDKIADDTPENAQRNSLDRKLEEQEQKDNMAKGKEASKEIFDTTGFDCTPKEENWIDLLTAMRIESGRLVKREIVHNYSRPSRREEFAGVILPSARHTVSVPRVDVYIDVSGSMGNTPLTIFNGLKSILSHMIVYRPRFFAFNTEITPVQIRDKKFDLGGGTDIRKVLDKIEQDRADLAIVITDCEDSIKRSDFKKNVVVVSNNQAMADFVTQDWKKVKKT